MDCCKICQPRLIEEFRRRAWESGLTCAGIAAVIFSLSSLQVKLTGGRVPVLELCIIRSSISFCTSAAVGAASNIKPLFGHRPHLHLLFLRGLFGTFAISSSYVALLNLPLGDAVTLSQLRPPITAVMARLLLNEPLGWLGLLGCILSLAGATLLAHPPFLFGGHSSWGSRRLMGTLCGMSSPIFGAGVGYCIRRIRKKEPALVVALWFHTVTIGLLVWPLLAGWPQAAVLVEGRDAALLLGISCSSFCAQLLMTRAFQLVPAARAASLTFMGVVYSHILGALVFHEELTWTTLAGGLLIFAGVLLVTLKAGDDDGANNSKAEGAATHNSDKDSMDSTDPEAEPLKGRHTDLSSPERSGAAEDGATAVHMSDNAQRYGNGEQVQLQLVSLQLSFDKGGAAPEPAPTAAAARLADTHRWQQDHLQERPFAPPSLQAASNMHFRHQQQQQHHLEGPPAVQAHEEGPRPEAVLTVHQVPLLSLEQAQQLHQQHLPRLPHLSQPLLAGHAQQQEAQPPTLLQQQQHGAAAAAASAVSAAGAASTASAAQTVNGSAP